jgi:glucose-1-phosphate cytidylyltransferase
MKVAILAGGMGTRLLEETKAKSKALVQIGGRPILWHLLQYYRHFGFDEFVVALGYKGETVRGWFAQSGEWRLEAEDHDLRQRWRSGDLALDLVDTGLATENGGRVKRLAPYLGEGRFMLTWCDGLSDVDLGALGAFHRGHGRLATLTAVRPPARFGRLSLIGDAVAAFDEKMLFENEWINGAFFVLEPEVLDWIEGDGSRFEHDVLRRLAAEDQLMAYRHGAFWQCMDTLKEAQDLEKLWLGGNAPWKVWE